MASRGGTRPDGSDGSDHWHRESIAWQYKIRYDSAFDTSNALDSVANTWSYAK